MRAILAFLAVLAFSCGLCPIEPCAIGGANRCDCGAERCTACLCDAAGCEAGVSNAGHVYEIDCSGRGAPPAAVCSR